MAAISTVREKNLRATLTDAFFSFTKGGNILPETFNMADFSLVTKPRNKLFTTNSHSYQLLSGSGSSYPMIPIRVEDHVVAVIVVKDPANF